MVDALLLSAGLLGMLIAAIHGCLGERRLLSRVAGLPDSAHRVLWAVFHLSTVYWFAGGAVLVLAALTGLGRETLPYAVAALYLTGAVANLWAFRGRHFGAPLLALAAGLAASGA